MFSSYRFSLIPLWHWKRMKLSVKLHWFIYSSNPIQWRLPPWNMDKLLKNITSSEMQILIQNFSFGLMLHVIFEKQSFLDTFCCYQLSIFTQLFHRSQLLLILWKRKALIFQLPFSLLATSKSWHFSDRHNVLCHIFCPKERAFNAGVWLTLFLSRSPGTEAEPGRSGSWRAESRGQNLPVR